MRNGKKNTKIELSKETPYVERVAPNRIVKISRQFQDYLKDYVEDFHLAVSGYFAMLCILEQANTDTQVNLNKYKTVDEFLKNTIILNPSAYSGLGGEEEPVNVLANDKDSSKNQPIITWYSQMIRHIDMYVAERFYDFLLRPKDIDLPPELHAGTRLIDKYLHESEYNDKEAVDAMLEVLIKKVGVAYFHNVSNTLYETIKNDHPLPFFNRGKIQAYSAINTLLKGSEALEKVKAQEESLNFEDSNNSASQDLDSLTEEEANDIAQDLRTAHAVHKDTLQGYLSQASRKNQKRLYKLQGKMTYDFYKEEFEPYLKSLRYEVSPISIQKMALLSRDFDIETIKELATFNYN